MLQLRHCRVPFTSSSTVSYGLLLFGLGWAALMALAYSLIFFLDLSAGGMRWNKALGHINVINLALLFFPAARRSPLLMLFGISWERSVTVHRFLARVFVLGVVVHGVGFIIGLLSNIPGMVSWNEMAIAICFGLAAGTIVLLIAFVSWFRVVREKWFELFYVVHHTFVLLVPLVVLHSMMMEMKGGVSDWSIFYLIVPISIYIVDRVLRVILSFTPSKLVSIEALDNCVLLAVDTQHSFRPGQYAFLNCPKISLTEWHPFSYVSSSKSKTRFLIQAVGDRDSWSRKLLKLAKRNADYSVVNDDDMGDSMVASLTFENTISFRVDGPYGSFVKDFSPYDSILLIAAGVGSAPLVSIFDFLTHSPPEKLKRLRFVWIFRSASQIAWHDDFLRRLSDEQAQCVVFYQTGEIPQENMPLLKGQGSVEPEKVTLHYGRPSLDQLFDEAAKGFGDDSRFLCVCCASETLAGQVANTSIKRSEHWDFAHQHFLL